MINELPRLAVGSHPAGSGKACVMNAISLINGDTVITDMPSCADPLLSKFAQNLNDAICTHRDGVYLCGECTHLMWLFGARIIGTSEATKAWSPSERALLAAQLAMFAADQVAHLKTADAAYADAAADAAYADAAYAADAAYTAADAAYAAAYVAADAAADAAYAAAAGSKARWDFYTKLVDEFYRLTQFETKKDFFEPEEIAVVEMACTR